MRSLRASTWRWLGAVALGGGLLAGSVWYVAANELTSHLSAGLVAGAFAQEASPPAPPASAAPDQKNGRRPMGAVTQVAAEPAGFTLRTPAGAEMTFSVLESTVFMAGRDRLYRFDLLKVGDQVVVRGGGQGKGPDGAASTDPAARGNGKDKQDRVARANIAADGMLIARQVMVRPAGEQRERKKEKVEPAAFSPAGTTNGGSHGAGQ